MANQWKQVGPSVQTQVIVDPYYEWASATGFTYFFSGPNKEWFPVIVETRKPFTARQFAVGEWSRPHDWEKWLRVPSLYAALPDEFRETRYCVASVTRQFFKMLESSELAKVIRRVGLGLPTKSLLNVKHSDAKMLNARVRPKTVVTGIIDDGLAFAHERFRGRDGNSRIHYFWDQDASLGYSPSLGDGRELCKMDYTDSSGNVVRGIDWYLNQCDHGGKVDEDELYRMTNHVDFRRQGHKSAAMRIAHGTHVMDIACGADPVAAPDNRPIIGVQLPVATTADSSGATLEPQAVLALDYILERADRIGKRLPVAVNLSFGKIAGPHDGTSLLEGIIDDRISNRKAPLAVVLPAGNSHLARCHACVQLTKKQSQAELRWRVHPEDRTPSYMEVWLPVAASTGPSPKVEVQVAPPWGDVSPWMNEGEVWNWQPGANPLCQVVYKTLAETGSRPMILISLAPTASAEQVGDLAPSGIWLVRVRNLGADAEIHAWIQRDDTPYGYPLRGRQSYFEDSAYQRYGEDGRDIEVDNTSYVQRDGSINAIATGASAIVVGGFRRSDRRAAKYSAGGPIIARPPGSSPPPRTGNTPDAMAVSEDSVACHGVLAAGARSGSVVAMRGTSVAAPSITRWGVEEMGLSKAFDRTTVANNPPVDIPAANPPAIPANRVGAGRANRPEIKPRAPVKRFGP